MEPPQLASLWPSQNSKRQRSAGPNEQVRPTPSMQVSDAGGRLWGGPGALAAGHLSAGLLRRVTLLCGHGPCRGWELTGLRLRRQVAAGRKGCSPTLVPSTASKKHWGAFFKPCAPPECLLSQSHLECAAPGGRCASRERLTPRGGNN